MFDRTILAFDIETIPDPDLGRRIHGIEGDDAAVVAAMAQRRLAETRDATRYPQLAWHRLVCACVTELDPTRGTVSMRALGGDGADERAVIAAFFATFDREAPPPRLLSWNGSGFDLPVLRYRAMKHGIAARGFHAEGARYGERREDAHVDLMDVLSGYGASARQGLGSISELLALPGKGFLDREVYEHWFSGERARVVEYCKLDTLETLLVFLAWTVHTGALERAELDRYVASIRELVAAQQYPAWTTVTEALRTWPPWG